MPISNSVYRMFVYILHCSDDTFYTGVTNNIESRVNQHNRGMDSGSYTYLRRPVRLVYYAGFQNAESAIAFEKKIKKWSRAKKIALINGAYESLPNLSKKKFKK